VSYKAPFSTKAKHRSDEEGRSTDVLQGREVNRFEEFSSEGNMEPRAEREEEACVPPSEVGEVVSVNLFDLFEKAKAASNIDSRYLGDIHAGSPGEGIAGMYLVQDMPQGISANPSVTPTGYEGFDGRIWIDVRKQIQPWIAGKGAEDQVKPSTYQDDGIMRDTPGVSQQMIPSQDAANTIPAAPMSPAVPSVESR